MNLTPTTATDPAVTAFVAERGIEEVLHFTTNKGLLGIFATRAILSRDRLDTENYLEHIYTPNCRIRKDPDWTDYVSLSISRVNGHMFNYSKQWHQSDGVWWTILALDPSILADPGVSFATTNNTYTATVKRDTGVAGLSAMFADTVLWGHHNTPISRHSNTKPFLTTCPQAEVLYPGQVSIDNLLRIYVREPEHADTVKSWFDIFQLPEISVVYRPEVFR